MVDVIAIDGPGGVGKSTVGRRLAERRGYFFFSSGLIYRALGWYLRRAGWDGESEPPVERLAGVGVGVRPDGTVIVAGETPGEALYSEDAARAASVISVVPAVRERANAVQRETVERIGREGAHRGVVLEGRDIGTVVFPEATHKFFLTAEPEVRARRRHGDDKAGAAASQEAVASALQERDQRDSTRAVAPLRPADDAVVVDTTTLSVDEVLHEVLAHLEQG